MNANVRTLLFGTPIEESKKKLSKRTKGEPVRARGLGAVAAYTVLVISLAAVFLVVIPNLNANPDNPVLFAILWFFVGIAAIAGLAAWGGMPRTVTANSAIFTAFVLGAITIPFVVRFLQTQNILVGFVAVLFGVLFVWSANHASRAIALTVSGYKVGSS